MSGTRRERSIFVALVALAAIGLTATVFLALRHRSDRHLAQANYRAAALEAVDSAADRIEARLEELRVVDQLATELDAGALTEPRALERRLRDVLDDNSAISSIAVAFLLFGVLWTVRVATDSAALLGFNSAAVLGFCAVLFFVVIVAHTSLRESLAAQRIVYLEYFYFVLYIAILGVAVNAIQIAAPSASRWVRHGDNLLARLLYWPLLTLSLLWITVEAFG